MRSLPLLLLLACTSEAPTLPAAGPPRPLTLVAETAPLLGGVLWLRVDGAVPAADLTVGLSARGLGAGPCPPLLGGDCLDLRPPIQVPPTGTATADAAGSAAVRLRVPADPAFDGREVCLQALAVGSGLAGLSDPLCLTLDGDDDGDGVGDDQDRCPGFDDTLDADLDGTPDDCQPRLLAELPIDAALEDALGVVQATLALDHRLAGGAPSPCTGLGPRAVVHNLSPGTTTTWQPGDAAFDALLPCLTDGVDDEVALNVSRAGQLVASSRLAERDLAGAGLGELRLVVDQASFVPAVGPTGQITVEWAVAARWQLWQLP